MDIEGSTADLLSIRYPLTSNGSCCSSGSLLLSSPWPISSTPSPPSSTSSSSSSLATINEGTLLSLSSSSPSSVYSPPSSIPAAISPAPSDLSLGTGGVTGAVIFTTTTSSPCVPPAPASGTETAITLADPVSTHSFEVAHATGKSILCLHEQDHEELLHFSTSPSNTNCQHNHVNGNEESGGNRNVSTATSSCNIVETDSKEDFITVQSSLLDSGCPNAASLSLPMSTCSTNDTDGNLFPTLILTSTGTSNDLGEHVIPMRLYASLTSSSFPHNGTSDSCPTALNGPTMTTMSEDDPDETCILMTPMISHPQQLPLGNNELHQMHHHQVLISNGNNNENDEDNNGATLTLRKFSQHDSIKDLGGTDLSNQPTTLGGSSILIEDCYEKNSHDPDTTFAKLSTTLIDGYSSHGKLKDILMNGNSHNNHHNQQQTVLLSNSSTNEDVYMLRDLETCSSSACFMPKEEDDNALVEELKLHSVAASEEQSSFNEAINSIYHLSSASRNPFCDGNSPAGVCGDLLMVTTEEQHHGQTGVESYEGSTGAPSPSELIVMNSSSLSPTNISRTPSVIWSNSGGVVASVSSSNPSQMTFRDGHHSLWLKEEDLGDLAGIDEEDLLEAKEEMDDMGEYGEGDMQGVKGELKCKFCGFVCCSKSSLGIHERRHTGERPFACKFCGRLFNSAQCCKHHERLHTGDKPFQCSYCGKKYAVSTRLKRHERVHTREEPYKCTECNKTFRWFDAFRDHRNTHTGVPLYLCSVCGKTFTSYLKFYYHERGHLMKKERDRDRLAKQRLLSGGGVNDGNMNARWEFQISKGILPICTTIDILKSLQRNSSAGIISCLSAESNMHSNIGGKKAPATAGAKGNVKKGSPKGKKGSSFGGSNSIQFQ